MYNTPATALFPAVEHSDDLLSLSQPSSVFGIWVAIKPRGEEPSHTPYHSFLWGSGCFLCIPKLLLLSQVCWFLHTAKSRGLDRELFVEMNWVGHMLSSSAITLLDPDSSPKLLQLFSKSTKGEKKEVKEVTQDAFFFFLSALGAKCQFLSGTDLWPCCRLMHLVAFAAAVTQTSSSYLLLGKLLQPATYC